jgi:alpha-tubulin suppressor-like RCC1 family protein
VRCWGNNSYGQLGDGGVQPYSITPVEVGGIASATQLSSGGDPDSCAVLSNGHVECWGRNIYGELGTGTVGGYASVPGEVTGISSAIQVSVGARHTCALLSNAHVDCWGDNSKGELGNGTETNSDVPVEVTGISSAIQVSSGNGQTCALLSNAHVDCWGDNSEGELGNGTETSATVPVEVTGLSAVTQVSAGNFHTCAVLTSGKVECWGYTKGVALNPFLDASTAPVEVPGISTATQVSAEGGGSCAQLSSGHVRCWPGTGSSAPYEVTGIP